MATFPTLKTGAVVQFPAQRTLNYSTQVVRFLDGTEQRFSDFRAPLHQWTIKLRQLDETEMNSLREFFRIEDGEYGQFSFSDPWDGTVYPNCSLATGAMIESLEDTGGVTELVIVENRS